MKQIPTITRVGLILTLIGVLWTAWVGLLWHPYFLLVLGIGMIVLETSRRYVFAKASLKVLGKVFMLFSLLNFLRHQDFLVFIFSRYSPSWFEEGFHFWLFLLRGSIWLIPTIWVLTEGVILFFGLRKITFDRYLSTRPFWISLGIILVLFAMELPFFGVHSGWGETHGHSFWDAYDHFH